MLEAEGVLARLAQREVWMQEVAAEERLVMSDRKRFAQLARRGRLCDHLLELSVRVVLVLTEVLAGCWCSGTDRIHHRPLLVSLIRKALTEVEVV